MALQKGHSLLRLKLLRLEYPLLYWVFEPCNAAPRQSMRQRAKADRRISQTCHRCGDFHRLTQNLRWTLDQSLQAPGWNSSLRNFSTARGLMVAGSQGADQREGKDVDEYSHIAVMPREILMTLQPEDGQVRIVRSSKTFLTKPIKLFYL